MTKMMFIVSLHDRLSHLPQEDIEERLRFYIEMIEDRMEEGLSEEEAVAAVGSIDEIVVQIQTDITAVKPVAMKKKHNKRLKTTEIILLALGSPIWIALLVAAFAVILSLYISLWAIIISLWAAFASLVGCTLGCSAMCVAMAIEGEAASAIAMFGAGLVCAGLTILAFLGCKAATNGAAKLTKKIARLMKKWVSRKEEL